MLPATVCVPAPEPPARLLAAYRRSLAGAGHGNTAYDQAARSFLRRWPDPQQWAALPLAERLRANISTHPFLTFLMLSGRLQPGYDYLVERKLSSLWRYGPGSPLQPGLDRFLAAALELGFTERVASAVGSLLFPK